MTGELWTGVDVVRIPGPRLRRAAERLGSACQHLESALTEPDPIQVEGHMWKATAITAAAVGDVALARRYAVGGPSPLLAWPVTSNVPRQMTDVRALLTLLRMKIDLEGAAPRPLIIRCIAEMDRGLADIDDVLSDPPERPPALPAS